VGYDFASVGHLKFFESPAEELLDLCQELSLAVEVKVAEVVEGVLGLDAIHITVIDQGLYLLKVFLSSFIIPWVCSIVLAASGWFAFAYL
jgi:hypothetical protein